MADWPSLFQGYQQHGQRQGNAHCKLFLLTSCLFVLTPNNSELPVSKSREDRAGHHKGAYITIFVRKNEITVVTDRHTFSNSGWVHLLEGEGSTG